MAPPPAALSAAPLSISVVGNHFVNGAGQTIRLPIPPLNEQRRVEITKIASRYAEEARVAVRNVRRHAMDELKKAEKDGGISQDQVRDVGKQIQELTDQHIHTLDDLLAKKENEILQV